MTEKAIIADTANAAICAPRAIARRPRALPNMYRPPIRRPAPRGRGPTPSIA